MKRNPDLLFLPVTVTRTQLVECVLSFEGLPYRVNSSCAVKDENGEWVGHANCFGVLLLAARELGLLPATFNVDLPPAIWGQKKEKTLWEIIHYNFDKVKRPDMAPGDVVLMQYKDVDPSRNEPHHVLMCVAPGKIFHASDALGRCYVCLLDPLFEARIDSVWRLRNLKEN